MSLVIDEVRALLALFGRSAWGDLHVRSGGWEIFFAKPGGGSNPMVGAQAVVIEHDTISIDAPHLGMFFASRAIGDVVGGGDVIGQLEVLGLREDVRACDGGRIVAVLSSDGALVEYGTPLMRIAASA